MFFIILILCGILIFGQFWIIGVVLAFIFSVIYLMKYVNDRKKEIERQEESVRKDIEDGKTTQEDIDAYNNLDGKMYIEYRMKKLEEEKANNAAKQTII